MGMPVFGSPEYLWLLLLLPLFLLRRKKAGGLRGAFILAARLVCFALLVLALGEPHRRRRNDAVTTYFVLDHSGSVPENMRAWSLDVVRQAAARKARKEDRAGLIVFGDQAIVEETPTPYFQVSQIFSVVDDSNTDLSAAVRLALSSFPDDTQKRIALFTDGNETKGDLRAAVQRAAAAGVPIDVVPLKYQHAHEVLLDSLALPRKVQREEPFQIRTNVVSLGEEKGALRVFCDGQLVAQREVALRPGDNVFLFSHALKEPGFHLFEAEVAADRDGISQNNRAQAYSIIEEGALVLLAANADADVRHLAAALQEEGIAHRVRLAGALPRDLGEWQSYDAIVFANLGAEHVSMAQMEMLESLVKDLGTGFVMVGGEKSFGAGGYLGTPVERLLPVNLDVNQNQVLPNGGIAFVLDHIHCIGDRWTKDICAGTLRPLTPYDSFGVLAGGASGWPIPLQPATDKEPLFRAIDLLTIGDVAGPDGYLDRVRRAFEGSRCSYRHAVYVTDGMGNVVPSLGAVRRLREDRITLSVVVIEPRGADLGAFQEAARAGGGNFYVIQPHQRDRVPQVFIKESAVVKKGLYFEERFTPAKKEESEILEGIAAAELPPLYGYNISSRKGGALEVPLVSPHGDAVLAHWRYGLGKSAAFTSDASARWGKDWISWAKYKQFWAQAVRWCQRRIPPSPYQLTLEKGRKDGTCDAIIDAQDDQGNFVNFLQPQGMLVTPELQSKELSFEQTGPGRYKATFPADKTGGYVVNVQYAQDGRPYLLRGGYVPPYNPEYRRFEDNEAMLLGAADQTGGRALKPGMDFFAATGQAAYTSTSLWPFLLLVAACLFPFDVFVRRVIVGWSDLVALARAVVPRLRVRADPAGEALLAEREAIQSRHWQPSRPSTESVAAEEAPGGRAPEGPALPEDIEISQRLREAKKRAKKQFDQK